PVSKNQPLNEKVYKKYGELVSEIRYRNTYDKDGYVEVSLQQSDEWQEEYRFRYSLKDSKNNLSEKSNNFIFFKNERYRNEEYLLQYIKNQCFCVFFHRCRCLWKRQRTHT